MVDVCGTLLERGMCEYGCAVPLSSEDSEANGRFSNHLGSLLLLFPAFCLNFLDSMSVMSVFAGSESSSTSGTDINFSSGSPFSSAQWQVSINEKKTDK